MHLTTPLREGSAYKLQIDLFLFYQSDFILSWIKKVRQEDTALHQKQLGTAKDEEKDNQIDDTLALICNENEMLYHEITRWRQQCV